ncbi:hypothetical protein C2S52_021398 [Perilla frutescens var. hirtella]|nr:hypothetical protein C2S52_021398 [Perilla frutescens var. hirtella]
MKKGESSIPPIDKPKSPNTLDDPSYTSKIDWDPKYEFEAMAQYFRHQNQLIKDEFGNQVAELTKQIKKFTAQSTTPYIFQRATAGQVHSKGPNRDNLFFKKILEMKPLDPSSMQLVGMKPISYHQGRKITVIDPDHPTSMHSMSRGQDLEMEMVDKIFTCYDFSEIKKVQLASLEFQGYAASWWEMQELEKKLNQIKQGTCSIEEYHKELETVLNQVGKQESLNATIIRDNFEKADDDLITSQRLLGHLGTKVCLPHHLLLLLLILFDPEVNPDDPNGVLTVPHRSQAVGMILHPPPLFGRASHSQIHPIQYLMQPPVEPMTFNGTSVKPQDMSIATVDATQAEFEEEESEIPHVSLVSIRSLSINREEEQQSHGSVIKAVSQYAFDKLGFTTVKHPKPYILEWLTDRGTAPITVHILVGRPWQFDRQAIHDGLTNTYTIKRDGRTTILKPLSPKAILEDQEIMRAKFKEQ